MSEDIVQKQSFPLGIGSKRYECTVNGQFGPTQTLLALLRFAKGDYYHERSKDISIFDKLRGVLGDIYHPLLNDKDIMEITLRAYIESVQYPKFELNSNLDNLICDLLLSPSKGIYSIGWPFPTKDAAVNVSLNQVYEIFLKHIFSLFIIARIDWLPEPLFPEKQTQEDKPF
jgi:hypothetical protein